MERSTFLFLSSLLLLAVMYKVIAASCSCPAVSSNGYCADDDDCEKFYRCVDSTQYSFTCPNGTIWNQNLISCVHGFKMYNCSNSPIGFVCPFTNNTFHADPSDCAGFIQCWDTIPYHMKCRSDEIWFQDNETCIVGSC